jgi:LPXTG-motif cell wall-anchored protein
VLLPPSMAEAAGTPAEATPAAPSAEATPESLPTTGSATSPLLPLAVAGLALMALAGAAFVNNKRAA